jgi:hypothetical protein
VKVRDVSVPLSGLMLANPLAASTSVLVVIPTVRLEF